MLQRPASLVAERGPPDPAARAVTLRGLPVLVALMLPPREMAAARPARRSQTPVARLGAGEDHEVDVVPLRALVELDHTVDAAGVDEAQLAEVHQHTFGTALQCDIDDLAHGR